MTPLEVQATAVAIATELCGNGDIAVITALIEPVPPDLLPLLAEQLDTLGWLAAAFGSADLARVGLVIARAQGGDG